MPGIFENYKYIDTVQVPDFIKKCSLFIYRLYKWFFLVPFVAITTVVLGISAFLFAWLVDQNLASRIFAVTWAKLNAWATPMFVEVLGKENINEKQSYVVICNHQSLYDIFLLYGWLNIDFKWVMKKELRKIPVLGTACEAMGHIYIDRSDSATAIEEINRAKQRISNGTSVLFFPEGTRSKTGEMGPFKKGAFKMALDLGLPVLPITIKGTRDILPTKSADVRPGVAQMIIHPPIDIAPYMEANINLLMDRARHTIASAMN
jgi:1-acyl-sn-glycerol-3-phosphate acyltransferase